MGMTRKWYEEDAAFSGAASTETASGMTVVAQNEAYPGTSEYAVEAYVWFGDEEAAELDCIARATARSAEAARDAAEQIARAADGAYTGDDWAEMTEGQKTLTRVTAYGRTEAKVARRVIHARIDAQAMEEPEVEPNADGGLEAARALGEATETDEWDVINAVDAEAAAKWMVIQLHNRTDEAQEAAEAKLAAAEEAAERWGQAAAEAERATAAALAAVGHAELAAERFKAAQEAQSEADGQVAPDATRSTGEEWSTAVAQRARAAANDAQAAWRNAEAHRDAAMAQAEEAREAGFAATGWSERATDAWVRASAISGDVYDWWM